MLLAVYGMYIIIAIENNSLRMCSIQSVGALAVMG